MWFEKYIGLPYEDYNCGEFVELALNEHYEKDFKFPWAGDNPFFQTRVIRQSKKKFLQKTETPKDGDCIMMNAQGRLCHIGLFVVHNKKEYCLHSYKPMGSVVLTKINHLNNFSLFVEGFYTWLD